MVTGPDGQPFLCWHGDPHGEGHVWERPGCPEKAVRSWGHLLLAAKAAEATGDTPGVMAVLLASAGAAAQPSASRARGGRR